MNNLSVNPNLLRPRRFSSHWQYIERRILKVYDLFKKNEIVESRNIAPWFNSLGIRLNKSNLNFARGSLEDINKIGWLIELRNPTLRVPCTNAVGRKYRNIPLIGIQDLKKLICKWIGETWSQLGQRIRKK